jgi:PAS domain-containing protein
MDIYVISSNDTAASSLCQFLESKGFQAKAFCKIYDGLEQVRRDPPRMIMTTYDGGTKDVDNIFNTALEVKCHFVVIAKTQDRNHAIDLLAKGAFAYILEPLNVLELKTIVKRALESSPEGMKRFMFDILSNLEDGLCILDNAARFLFVNPRATEFLGLQSHELVGSALADLELTELNDLVAEAVAAASHSAHKEMTVGSNPMLVRALASVIHDSEENAAGHFLRFRLKSHAEADQNREFRKIEKISADLLERAAAAQELEECKTYLAQYNMIQNSIEELQVKLILDHISVPVDELIELPAIRAKNLVADHGEIEWKIDDPDLRLRCRRKLIEFMFSQAFISGLSAVSGGNIQVIVEPTETEIIFRLEDQGLVAKKESCFSISPNGQGRAQFMSLHMVQKLVKHHEGTLTLLEDRGGIEIRLTRH